MAIFASYQTNDFVVQVFQNDYTSAEKSQFLFNSAAHLRTQNTGEPLYSFRLTKNESSNFGAEIHFFVTNNRAVSLRHASFGSVDWCGDVPEKGLTFLIECVNNFSEKQKWASVEIRNFPHCYAPHTAERIEQVLLNEGFHTSRNQLNHHISVSETPFETIIGSANRRRLRKCQRAGFVFEQFTDISPQQVYDFIAASRARQQYKMTLDLPQLTRLLTELPEHFLVFCVKDHQTITCLTLAVFVNEKILYNFCPADNLDYRTYSPAVMLTEGLYEFAQRNEISILDLGISVDALGNPKPTLIKFKENLGGISSEKWTFKRDF